MKNAVDKIGEFNKFGSVLGLERIQELLRRLGNPEKDLKIIHVAGTNGKGSVSKLIYNSLREAGYSVGIYTSPFLEVFNERIEADGKYIPDDYLDKYAEKVSKIAKEMCDEGLLSPTEFDVVTSIGFMYFKEMNVDFVILEVGLGGRGDSTNVIEKPVITVITSISKDHTDRLGDTLEKIAWEKAGIVKEGVCLISGVRDSGAKKVIEEVCQSKNARFVDATKIASEIVDESLEGTEIKVDVLGEKDFYLHVKMIGIHQVQNAMVALQTLEELKNNDIITINCEEIKRAFDNTCNPGRFEVISKNPLIILDGAHNEDGVKSFVKTVNTDLKDKKLLTVVGVLKDKDVEIILNNLKSINSDFIATEPDNMRKLSKDDLGELMKGKNINVVDILEPKDCVKFAMEKASQYDGILFVGSLYLIGEIRRLFTNVYEEKGEGTAIL